MTKTHKSNAETASLSFPNPSRSYDETKRGVRFWGYDRTFEISFLVEEDALSKLDPETRQDETGFLSTFDVSRDRIRATAGNIYSRRRKAAYIFSYILTGSDF
jgi:hypothetical protein